MAHDQNLIDLFSDTNCDISFGMRQAMAQAKVGNEVAGEDPTVNHLIERCCDYFKMEAGVFLVSGSQCNILAYRAWCKSPGMGIIIEHLSQPVLKNPTIFSGLVHGAPLLIHGKQGTFTSDQLKNVIQENHGYNHPQPTVVSIENPTNFGGGIIWPEAELGDVIRSAQENELPVHIDGARLLTATTVVQNDSFINNLSRANSIYIDFCKCVGAPMGSVLLGSKDFIDFVWFHKFQMGAYMHKAGSIAAACLYGWDHQLFMMTRVVSQIKKLAKILAEFPFLEVDSPQINILFVRLKKIKLSAFQFQEKMLKYHIRVLAVNHEKLRIIFHLDIEDPMIERIAACFHKVGCQYMIEDD